MQPGVIHIKSNDPIQNIQNQICNIFPSVQIRFFRDLDYIKHADQCVMFSPSVPVCAINPDIKDFEIKVSPDMQADDLENVIQAKGLPVQFYKIK